MGDVWVTRLDDAAGLRPVPRILRVRQCRTQARSSSTSTVTSVLRSAYGGMRVFWIYRGEGEVFVPKGYRTQEGDGRQSARGVSARRDRSGLRSGNWPNSARDLRRFPPRPSCPAGRSSPAGREMRFSATCPAISGGSIICPGPGRAMSRSTPCSARCSNAIASTATRPSKPTRSSRSWQATN